MTRKEAIDLLDNLIGMVDDNHDSDYDTALKMAIKALEQEPKTGHCKDCKYFEYDSVAKVDGIPLIVAHEICKRWGDGCKTREDGFCFMFEPRMTFKVIDIKTGKEPTDRVINNIAQKGGLMTMDIDQFFIGEDGTIVLADDCGNITYCDMERFKAVAESEVRND